MKRLLEQTRITMRNAGSRMLALLGVLGVMVMAGCQTVESTQLVGSIEETGSAKEETGERRVFLEVVSPEPEWVQREAALRKTWLTTAYDADRRRTFRAFEIPDTYTFDVDDFKRDARQADRTGPYLLLQLRERQFSTVKKQHQVQTRSVLSGAKTERKTIPIFSQWKWEPGKVVKSGVAAWVRAEDLDDEPGLWHLLEGAFDEQGNLVVSLVPWIDAGIVRSRKGPLVLRLTSQEGLPPVFVRVTPDALFYLQQLHARSDTGEATSNQIISP